MQIKVVLIHSTWVGDNFQRLMFYPENEAQAKPPPSSTHLMAINCLKHQLAGRSASFALLQKGGKLMNYGRRRTIKNTTKRSSMPIKTRQNDCCCRLKSDKTAPFLPASIPLEIHTLHFVLSNCSRAKTKRSNCHVGKVSKALEEF